MDLPPIDFDDQEQLRVLRRLNPVHPWRSLAEKRTCPSCRSAISAEELELVGGTRGWGPLRLQCPICSRSAFAHTWKPIEKAPAVTDSTVILSHHGHVCRCRRKRRGQGNSGGQDRSGPGHADRLVSFWHGLKATLLLLHRSPAAAETSGPAVVFAFRELRSPSARR